MRRVSTGKAKNERKGSLKKKAAQQRSSGPAIPIPSSPDPANENQPQRAARGSGKSPVPLSQAAFLGISWGWLLGCFLESRHLQPRIGRECEERETRHKKKTRGGLGPKPSLAGRIGRRRPVETAWGKGATLLSGLTRAHSVPPRFSLTVPPPSHPEVVTGAGQK